MSDEEEFEEKLEEIFSYGKEITFVDNWRTALRMKAVQVSAGKGTTLGYKVIFYLWSADIWFGKFPLLKFIIVANIIVWTLGIIF